MSTPRDKFLRQFTLACSISSFYHVCLCQRVKVYTTSTLNFYVSKNSNLKTQYNILFIEHSFIYSEHPSGLKKNFKRCLCMMVKKHFRETLFICMSMVYVLCALHYWRKKLFQNEHVVSCKKGVPMYILG